MGKIALEGMQFYAYHGVYEEEQIIGNNFMVDIYIETSYGAAAETDDIQDTLNYETVYLVIQTEMKKTVRLLETLIENIIHSLKYQFSSIQEVKLRIRKQNPIPGHRVGSSFVEETSSFVNQCPRCQRPFICYADDTCWCQNKQVHPGTREMLRSKYNGCLCESCLTFYAG